MYNNLRSRFGGKMCEDCGNNIRKVLVRSCSECSKRCCEDCLTPRGRSVYHCHCCRVLSEPFVSREDLGTLSIKTLQAILLSRDRRVASQMSIEKASLIESILINQAIRCTDLALKAQHQLIDPTVLAERNWISQKSPESDIDSKDRESESTRHFDPSSVRDLSDLSEPGQIKLLAVRQLKIILQRNCIDFKGCLEKDELQQRLERLWFARKKHIEMEEKIATLGDSAAEQEFMCKICMDAPVNCVLLDCGHMLTCVSCGKQLNECPVCRQYVIRVVHAFKL